MLRRGHWRTFKEFYVQKTKPHLAQKTEKKTAMDAMRRRLVTAKIRHPTTMNTKNVTMRKKLITAIPNTKNHVKIHMVSL